MINKLITNINDRLAKRREYLRLVEEIEGMTQRDLIEIGAFKGDLLVAAHAQVYGA